MHEPPTVERILHFNKSGEQCPDPNDLCIDMKGMISSKWNKAVIQILLALVTDKLGEEEWLPDCSDTFLRDKIQKAIEKGRALWHQTEAKVVEDGTVETTQQVEDRIIREKAAGDARARAYARRSNVSIFSLDTQVYDLIFPEEICNSMQDCRLRHQQENRGRRCRRRYRTLEMVAFTAGKAG